MTTPILTDQNFAEILMGQTTPILIDFWTEWCIPCQMLTPILEEISQEFGNQIIIAKCNVDENPIISSKFSIDVLPTILLIYNKKILQRFIGVQNKEIIATSISKLFLPSNQNIPL